MGLFSRKNKVKLPVMRLKIDIHSHVLPGIDDGSRDISESMYMLRAFEMQGYTKVITTPHVHSERYMNDTENIRNAYEQVMEAKEKENINIELDYAAEYFADRHLLKLIETGDVLTFGANYVLCEFSFHMPPVGAERVADALRANGYQPVLAHPERYEYWHGNKNMFERLRNMGYLFQSNMHAAEGFYGQIPKRNIELIAAEGWIEFLGTDAHSPNAIDLISTSIENKTIQSVIQSGTYNQSL